MKKIMPPNYFMALLFSSIIFHFITPLYKLIYSPYIYLGIIFIIFGAVLNLWTDSLFKKNHTTVKPDKTPGRMLTEGPFKISRHPMYLGMALILLGAAVFMGSLITFVFPVIFVILMEKIFIPIEEKNMENQFKDKFLEYKKKVRRWI